MLPTVTASSPWDVPSPVLFNTWKHHAGALRERIRTVIAGGAPALKALADDLVVMGSELMDLYTGPLTPAEIAAKVLEQLQADNRLSLPEYRAWVQSSGGY